MLDETLTFFKNRIEALHPVTNGWEINFISKWDQCLNSIKDEEWLLKLLKNEIQPQATPVENKVSEENKEKISNNNIIIKSPMIGTFYRSPNPESDPFVSEGDSIKVGQTICIVEAMKLFNDIESEVSGKIVKILVDDNSPIEFDQPLFEVDPS